MSFAKTVWSLCGRVNADLRVLVSWLKANKISLNASKTEFVIFRSPWKRLDSIPRLKLAGKMLTPSKWVKYLGVHMDEHLNWKHHVSTIAAKLRRADGAISRSVTMFQLKLYLMFIMRFSFHMSDMLPKFGLCATIPQHREFKLFKILQSGS